MSCEHKRLVPEVCDQTLGVACLDCGYLVSFCWADDHLPETLWNRACENDSEAVRCEQNRDYFCAICGDLMTKETKK